MGTSITDVVGGPHDFLPPRSDRSDEFQKLCLDDPLYSAQNLEKAHWTSPLSQFLILIDIIF